MKKWILIGFMLTLAAVSSASAEFYVGASAMSTSAEFESAVDSFDSDEFAWKVYGGFTFFKFLGIEASYRDLGDHSDTMGVNAVDADLTCYDLSARGILPIGDHFRIFARAGYGNISADGEFDLDGMIEDFDEDDWELMYGVGVEVIFGGHIGIRAEWEEYDVDTDLNSVSAGVFFKF